MSVGDPNYGRCLGHIVLLNLDYLNLKSRVIYNISIWRPLSNPTDLVTSMGIFSYALPKKCLSMNILTVYSCSVCMAQKIKK